MVLATDRTPILIRVRLLSGLGPPIKDDLGVFATGECGHINCVGRFMADNSLFLNIATVPGPKYLPPEERRLGTDPPRCSDWPC